MGKPNHRADQRSLAAFRLVRAADERLVDLDLVERHALQIAERRIAGPEIVERELDADVLQARDHVVNVLIVAQQHAFGNLQLEALGGEAGFAEHSPDQCRKRMRFELDRREVDGDRDMLRPVCGFGASGAKHPFADFVDEAEFLGERNERRGTDRAVLRVVPADQRFEARHVLGRSVDARLVDDAQLFFLDRHAKIGFHHLPFARRLMHFRREETEAPLARRLRGVKRQVGITHEIVRRAVVVVGGDDADRSADRHCVAVDRVRPRQAVDDALREFRQVFLVGGRGQHNFEFVTAEAADLSRLADHVAQTQRDEAEQRVAGGMAKRVVDCFEPVEIEQEHRAAVLAADRGEQCVVERAAKHFAIGEPGQRILPRQPVELDLRLAHLGQIGCEAAEPEEAADAVMNRLAGNRSDFTSILHIGRKR